MSETKVNCANCEIRQDSLFSNLSESMFAGLDFTPEISRHRPQDIMIRQSSKTDAIYTIRRGIVKLESRLPDGSKRIVRLLSSGDTLGVHAWQLGEHPHEAVALTDVELCHIPYAVLESLQQRSDELNRELLLRCCHDSQMADLWITRFSTGSVNRRLAYLLMHLLEMQRRSGESLVQLMVRDDMAAILGVRQESVSRTITQFKQEGLLTQVKRDTYQVDEAGLRQKIR